ncbi:MAG: prepilin-type N-terminal cleavage/methylation domain-containing protein [Kiritimatiellia bacterium]|nr:prepilin-type N-terminal cleavage/methylation domain-containing protein [Kiritimatiellia bacterium]
MNNRGTRTSPNSGMTLIEVLLALTLLAMGLTALTVGSARCLAVVRQARNYETARRLLTRVEVESPLDPESEAGIEEGEDGGEFDDVPGFRWTRTVAVVGEEEDGLWEVVTRIEWADDRRASKETITTWIYAKKSSQP